MVEMTSEITLYDTSIILLLPDFDANLGIPRPGPESMSLELFTPTIHQIVFSYLHS